MNSTTQILQFVTRDFWTFAAIIILICTLAHALLSISLAVMGVLVAALKGGSHDHRI